MVRKLTTKEIYFNNAKRKKESQFHETILILHNIRSMHNVGSIFRTSDAFGIKHLYLTGYTPLPPRAEISKAALGAEEFVDWSHSPTIDPVIQELKQFHYEVIGCEQTNKSKELQNFHCDFNKKYALILGNEATGIEDEVLQLADVSIEIPQFGQKHSFNVSVSAGIILYHFFHSLH